MSINKTVNIMLPFIILATSLLAGCFEGGAFDITKEAQLFDGTLGPWTTSGSVFTDARYGNTSVAYNGYLYVIGGWDNGSNYYDDVQYARINKNGSLGPWMTAGSSFANGRAAHASVVHNGYLYVIGGLNGNNSYDDVQYARIKEDGDLEPWVTAGTAFDTGRYALASVVENGYLYVIGGLTEGTYYDDIQYARIKTDGDLESWTTAAYRFTNGRSGHSSVVQNGYLFVIGGMYSPVNNFNDVQYAPLYANGSPGTWTVGSSFSTPRRAHASVVYRGYLYVIGGWNGSTNYYDVQYIRLNENGTSGTWKTASPLPATRRACGSVVFNGYLYLAGGMVEGDTLSNEVIYAKFSK